MKKIYIFLVAVLTFSFQLSTFNCSAQWQQVMTGFPVNNQPYYLTSFDDVVFCWTINNSGYINGFYWSLDNGLSWSFRDSVGGMAYKNRLYKFSVNYDTVLVSLDSGLTYNNSIMNNKNTIIEQKRLQSSTVISQNGAGGIDNMGDTVIFLGSGNYFRSYDQGWSWYKYPIENADGGKLVFTNQSSFFFILNYVTSNSYIKKLDYQSQLQTIYTSHIIPFFDPCQTCINSAIWVDSLLFICAPNYLKVLHTNGSVQNVYNGGVYSIAQYGDTIFIACGTDVLKANKNDYTNWVTMSDGLSGTYGVSTLYLYKNYLFAITNTDGILYRRELTPVSGINITENNRKIELFPNPTTTQVNIIFEKTTGSATVTVYNIYGFEVYNNNLHNTGTEFTQTIDVSSWAKGMYIVKVNTEDGIKTAKLVVE